MTQLRVPDEMTAVILESFSGPEALRVEKRPTPKPGKDEVLIRIAASPINPSDLAYLEGQYGFKNIPPVVPGGEGSGTVVAVGPGMAGRYFLGKRVACLNQGSSNGMWAEYVVTSALGGVLPLHSSVSLEQGAMSMINPLTASAFLEIAKKGRHKTIVLTAAASSLGQMVNRLCLSEGMQVINVVRREAQVALLRGMGAAVVLNSSAADFDQQLHDACQQAGARLAFDAVAGPMTQQLLDALPQHSQVTVYSCLSHKAPQVGHDHLIFEDKTVTGFWLGPWIRNMNLLQILMLWRRAQNLMGVELKSNIRAQYPFKDAKKAVQDYLRQMTGGKILLKPKMV